MRPTASKLHLGCFDQVYPGWHNTDVTRQRLIARVPGLAGLLHRLGRLSPDVYAAHQRGVFRHVHYLDLTRPFPFAAATFDYVFSAHVLEHLFPPEAEDCLREVHRVLRPGGVLRLVVPDLDRMVAEYDPANTERLLDQVYQGRERRTHVRARHWWHYNAQSLASLLHRVGFAQVERRAYRQGRCADLETIDSRPESLFMEAIR
jgi:predicted SAM-dependent methyltransferase